MLLYRVVIVTHSPSPTLQYLKHDRNKSLVCPILVVTASCRFLAIRTKIPFKISSPK